MGGLDMWFRDDVGRILIALASAGANRGPEYLAALHDVALAFGLDVRPNEVDHAAHYKKSWEREG